MPGFNEQFLDKENFFIAFKKVSSFLHAANEWYDPIGLIEYEARLEDHIPKLIDEIQSGNYQPKSLQPLPFPKKNTEDGEGRIRPYFVVHLDDQLIMAAAVNVVADLLEHKMPDWSYGNRLFRPVWYELDEKGKKKLNVGSCKNSSAHLFRSWQQSWPRYKRHISMTIKVMSKGRAISTKDFDDPIESKLFEQAENDNFRSIKYLSHYSWHQKNLQKLYWTGLDFQKFFPSINPDKIINNLLHFLVKDNGEARDDVDVIIEVIRRFLHSQIDITGWSEQELSTHYSTIDFGSKYYGLPTGLLVAGFLANVAMLDIDLELEKIIQERKDTAIFKYVDDHIIISQTPEALQEVLNQYHLLLQKRHSSVTFQPQKIEPVAGWNYTSSGFQILSIDAIEVDVEYPEPLMTSTLQKISALDQTDMDLMPRDELERLESDIKHLFLTDLPATEIRKDTKISFAAGKICAIARQIKPDFSKLDPYSAANQITLNKKIAELRERVKTSKLDSSGSPSSFETLTNDVIEDMICTAFSEATKEIEKKHERLFKLLLKGLRENPDKVKLWRRAIEFCYITGYNGLNQLMRAIEESCIHILSQSYIYAYCLLNIQLYLERACSIVKSEDGLFWKGYCSWCYIKNVCALDILPNDNVAEFPFKILSVFNLRAIASFANRYCGDVPDILSIVRKNINHTALGTICTNDIFSEHALLPLQSTREAIVWYCINRISWPEKEIFVATHVNRLDLEIGLTWNILSSFPREIPGKQFLRMREFLTNNKNAHDKLMVQIAFERNNALTLELFQNLKESDPKTFKKTIGLYPYINRIIKRSQSQYISLDMYVLQLVEKDDKSGNIEVKLSEWSLIEIVRQIVKLTQKSLRRRGKTLRELFSPPPRQHLYLHPANYLVPIEWLTTNVSDWNSWKDIMRKKPLKLARLTHRIDDNRYFPISNLWNYRIKFFGDNELPLVIGYSMLLVKLLSRSFTWPYVANKIVFIDQLFSQAHYILEKESLSSNSRILLSAIFAKNKFDSFSYDKIELGKDVAILGLDSFLIWLSAIQSALAVQQMNLLGRQPRQLIYINLDDLEGSRELFFEKICKNS